jgi:hypothetical protein
LIVRSGGSASLTVAARVASRNLEFWPRYFVSFQLPHSKKQHVGVPPVL